MSPTAHAALLSLRVTCKSLFPDSASVLGTWKLCTVAGPKASRTAISRRREGALPAASLLRVPALETPVLPAARGVEVRESPHRPPQAPRRRSDCFIDASERFPRRDGSGPARPPRRREFSPPADGSDGPARPRPAGVRSDGMRRESWREALGSTACFGPPSTDICPGCLQACRRPSGGRCCGEAQALLPPRRSSLPSIARSSTVW